MLIVLFPYGHVYFNNLARLFWTFKKCPSIYFGALLILKTKLLYLLQSLVPKPYKQPGKATVCFLLMLGIKLQTAFREAKTL